MNWRCQWSPWNFWIIWNSVNSCQTRLMEIIPSDAYVSGHSAALPKVMWYRERRKANPLYMRVGTFILTVQPTAHSQLHKACLEEEIGLVSPSSWGHISHRGVQHQLLQTGGLFQKAVVSGMGDKRSSWLIYHGSVHLRDHTHELQVTAGKWSRALFSLPPQPPGESAGGCASEASVVFFLIPFFFFQFVRKVGIATLIPRWVMWEICMKLIINCKVLLF